MKSDCLLSIIIPVYNIRDSWFSRCLESMRDIHNKPGFEIIVIDDGSQAPNSSFYQNELKKIENSIYEKKENGGVSSARNRGLDLASGRYIMFIDADDEALPGCFNQDLLNKNYDFICFDSVYVNKGQEALHHEMGMESCEISKEDLLEAILSKGKLMPPWAKAFKREIIEKNSFRFNTDFVHGEDALFNMLYFEHVDQAFYCAVSGYRYYFELDNYDNRWNKNHHAIMSNYLEKNNAMIRILEQSSLKNKKEIHNKLDNDNVTQILRMCFADHKKRFCSRKDWRDYLNEFHIDYNVLTKSGKLKYQVIRGQNVFFLKVLLFLRSVHLKNKYK